MTAADLIAEIDARLRRHHNDNGMVYLETPTGYFAPWQQIKTIRAALASRASSAPSPAPGTPNDDEVTAVAQTLLTEAYPTAGYRLDELDPAVRRSWLVTALAAIRQAYLVMAVLDVVRSETPVAALSSQPSARHAPEASDGDR